MSGPSDAEEFVREGIKRVGKGLTRIRDDPDEFEDLDDTALACDVLLHEVLQSRQCQRDNASTRDEHNTPEAGEDRTLRTA